MLASKFIERIQSLMERVGDVEVLIYRPSMLHDYEWADAELIEVCQCAVGEWSRPEDGDESLTAIGVY